MTARPRRFAPTHEITLKRGDGAREVVPIKLVNGVGYTRVEWDSETAADWELHDGTWTWQSMVCPPGYVSCSARRLGRGSEPRGPSKATERLTINLRADQLELYRGAAGELKLTRWAVRELDKAAGEVKTVSRTGGCIICDAAASGLFCAAHGAAYDRAAEKFSGDEQSVMKWIADAARRNERSSWRRWHSMLEATEHAHPAEHLPDR